VSDRRLRTDQVEEAGGATKNHGLTVGEER
jgi:hypothetical protein